MYRHFFFFNDTATTEIYTLSLHDALPIYLALASRTDNPAFAPEPFNSMTQRSVYQSRSEEHTSELQSRLHLVCRLLLEKKKKSNFFDIVLYCATQFGIPTSVDHIAASPLR